MANNKTYRNWEEIREADPFHNPLTDDNIDLDDEATKSPDFWTTLGAAMKSENVMINAYEKMSAPQFGPEEDYIPNFDTLESKYLDYVDDFASVDSKSEEYWLKNSIDDQLAAKEVLANADFGTGIMATLMAGAADPINIIPVASGFNKARQAASAVGRVGYTALGGAVAGAVAEVPLQAMQETRTVEEGVAAIGGSALLFGIVGGTAASIMKRTGDDIRVSRQLDAELNDEPTILLDDDNNIIGGELYEVLMQDANFDLRNSAGLIELAGRGTDKAPIVRDIFNTPSLQLATSSSTNARATHMLLAEDSFERVRFESGQARPDSVELGTWRWEGALQGIIKRWRGGVAEDTQFSAKGLWKENKQELLREYGSKKQFQQQFQVDSFRYGNGALDEDWVAAATTDTMKKYRESVKYWSDHFDEKLYHRMGDELESTGLLPEGTRRTKYRPQLWDRTAMRRNGSKFREASRALVSRWMPDATPEEIIAKADDLTGYIKGMSKNFSANVEKTPADLEKEFFEVMGDAVAKSARFKNRQITIPHDMLESFEPFLMKDPEMLASTYVRQTAGQLELTKKLGSIKLDTQINLIRKDYEDLIVAAEGKPRRQKSLEKEMDRTIENVEFLRDLILGKHRQYNKILATGQALNAAAKLGMVTISSGTDIARLGAVHGVMPYMKAFKQKVLNPFKRLGKENNQALLEFGVMADLANGSRFARLADIDTYGDGDSVIDKALFWMRDVFDKVSIFGAWQNNMKQMAAFGSQDTMLKYVERAAKGTINQSEKIHLANMGVDVDRAGEIWQRLQDTGAIKTYQDARFSPRYVDFDALLDAQEIGEFDEVFVEQLQNYILRESYMVINTPRLGDLPKVMRTNNLARPMFQFKSFMYAFQQQTIVPLAQQRGLNARTANMWAAAVSTIPLAMITMTSKEYLRLKSKGEDHDTAYEESFGQLDRLADIEDPEIKSMWYAAFDQSGYGSAVTELMNIDQRAGLDVLGAMGVSQGSKRFGSANAYEVLAGPMYGAVIGSGAKMANMAERSVKKGEIDWTESDTSTIRRLLPFQNVFTMRHLVDEAQEWTNEQIGARSPGK